MSTPEQWMVDAAKEIGTLSRNSQRPELNFYDEGSPCHLEALAILYKHHQSAPAQAAGGGLEAMYQKVVTEVLFCDPIPASKRADDQLEPPWEVIARIRTELAAQSTRVRALEEALKEANWALAAAQNRIESIAKPGDTELANRLNKMRTEIAALTAAPDVSNKE